MATDRFVEALEASGARAWSIYATSFRRLSLGTKDRESGNPHAPFSVSEGLAAAYKVVWADGRVSRGSLERRQIELEVDDALRQARSAAIDDPDGAFVPEPSEIPDVAIHAPETAAIAAGEVERVAERLAFIRKVVVERGVRTWSGSISASEGLGRIVTSTGMDASGKGTTFGWSAVLDGELGAGRSLRVPESRELFESRVHRIVDTVLKLREPAASLAGGLQRVLLHPDVVEEYVLGTLFSNLDGATVAHAEGAFRKEQFGSGDPVLREDLGLTIDPWKPLGPGSYRFSTEGVPSKPTTLIDRGRLVTPILDLKYGRRLGMAPTAHALSMEAVAFTAASEVPYAEAEREAAALILSVLGVHTQDTASGDFSLSAPQAWSRKGGRVKATISGNLFALLRDPGTTLVRFEDETTPGLLVTCRIDPR